MEGIIVTIKLAKEIRVEALLDAAIEEFVMKGYDGASIDAIAKRAGVSKGGVYHHFPSKEILLMEANRKLTEPVMLMVEKAYNNESAYSGLYNYIREYLKYWIERPRELSFFFLSMAKALQSDILMNYYKDYMAMTTEFFCDMFQRIDASNEKNYKDPEVKGITLMGALDGILSYLITNPDKDIEQFVERMGKIWFEE